MQEVRTCYQFIFIAFMAELVDATVSKAADRNIMKVRVLLEALIIWLNNYFILHEITFGATFRMGIE